VAKGANAGVGAVCATGAGVWGRAARGDSAGAITSCLISCRGVGVGFGAGKVFFGFASGRTSGGFGFSKRGSINVVVNSMTSCATISAGPLKDWAIEKINATKQVEKMADSVCRS
jgi:hypothetical protein